MSRYLSCNQHTINCALFFLVQQARTNYDRVNDSYNIMYIETNKTYFYYVNVRAFEFAM